jgi:putative PIN family toxin of toxin-antitoxin system
VPETGHLRVVLDTNVVLSALLFRQGTAPRFRHLWQAQALLPLVSAQTARELVRVLAYPKFRLSPLDREELLADYLPYAQVVRPEDHSKALARLPRSRDPFDDMLIDLAQAGKAQVLVTGDKDLLALSTLRQSRLHFLIMNPADALQHWGF